jgi:hypothetical protein
MLLIITQYEEKAKISRSASADIHRRAAIKKRLRVRCAGKRKATANQ